MVRKTKWIANPASGDGIEDVARHALAGRINFVWHFFSRAAAVDHQPEDIHQLRVATRRAMAAIEIFWELLPHRRARKMNKQLKRIRRAAGDARNLDVLAGRLKKDHLSYDADHSARLQDFANRLRKRAQPAIETLHVHLSHHDRFVRRARALVSRLRIHSTDEAEEPRTFAEAARQDLSPLVDQFFAAAAADLSQSEALHALRICGKRVRYAMEIFVGAFGSEMRQEIYPLIAEFQEKLGKINDHVTAVALYTDWLTRVDDSEIAELLQPLIAEERRAAEQGRHDFLVWWTPDRAADLRHQFDDQFAVQGQGQSA